MKSITWNKTKKDESVVFNKVKKEKVTRNKPTRTKLVHNKITKEKVLWNKSPKEKVVKKKVEKKQSTVVRNKEHKEKQSNANKDIKSLKDIISRIENWDFTETDASPIVEKITPRTDKRDYREVAYTSRWLDMDWDEHRFCEVTFELTGQKVNAEDIHHIFWREWSNYNNPEWLIFVCRKEHERISKYEQSWLKEIVKKYLIQS